MNRELTRTLLDAISACLKARGFRRRGQLFERAVNDVVQLVQVQKSQSSSAGCVRATLNMAVWVPALAQVRAGVRDTPSEPAAPLRERIGFAMDEKRDVWWEMGSDTEAQASAAAMVRALEERGLPYLERIESLAALIALWEAGMAPGLTEGERVRCLERARKIAGGAAQQRDAADKTG